MTLSGKALNDIIESNLFRNSGLKSFSIASVSSPILSLRLKPRAGLAKSAAPAFVVRIIIVFLKSTFLPF